MRGIAPEALMPAVVHVDCTFTRARTQPGILHHGNNIHSLHNRLGNTESIYRMTVPIFAQTQISRVKTGGTGERKREQESKIREFRLKTKTFAPSPADWKFAIDRRSQKVIRIGLIMHLILKAFTRLHEWKASLVGHLDYDESGDPHYCDEWFLTLHLIICPTSDIPAFI